MITLKIFVREREYANGPWKNGTEDTAGCVCMYVFIFVRFNVCICV